MSVGRGGSNGRGKSGQAALFEEVGDPQARRPLDYYATPAYQTAALLELEPGIAGPVLEPCCGDGAIVRELRRRAGWSVWTNDVDTTWPADKYLDATLPGAWDTFRRAWFWRWVVTNFPFNIAFPILQYAVEGMPREPGHGVACVLRLSWSEPTDDRGDWLEAHPPHRLIVLPRHDYRGNGDTDSVTSAWHIWYGDGPRAVGNAVVSKATRDRLIAMGDR